MERQVFLEKNRKALGANKKSQMMIDLDKKTRMLQDSSIEAEFSALEQYRTERDLCSKYRMIFVINPICSNILFNTQTEIVKDEGSPDVKVISNSITMSPGDISSAIQNTTAISRVQAIRDTEYSHPNNGNFEYHCGADIFNNHMLRNDSFVHVNKMNDKSRSEASKVFNTIKDYARDGEGNIIEGPQNFNDIVRRKLHLYTYDTIMTTMEAYKNRLKEKDGWVGFTNPGNIEIPNSDDTGTTINRLLSNKKPCEFIDMYPDRSLYSFIPKYNPYRHRIEKNWDYCITYPFEKDVDIVNEICGGLMGAIRVTVEEAISTSAIPILRCRSYFKHTLRANDQIYLYYNAGGDFSKYPVKVKVIAVGKIDGSEADRYFSIRRSDIAGLEDYLEDGLFYRKVSNGCECEYYARKYKKIANLDDSGNTIELNSEINKVAFGENIYGDRVAQVVFTDDIDVNGLYDHMGRPLSDVYFTVIKRHKGDIKWAAAQYGDDDVEYSHCFGKVTSGVDFGEDSGTPFDYNIRYLHNVDAEKIGDAAQILGDTIMSGMPLTLESGITIDDDIFYGDIVEFDPYNYTETEITPILHRFNTAQRENSNGTYIDFYDDRIRHDDYDVDEDGNNYGFSAVTYNLSKLGDLRLHTNVCPEGYFYNPHTKIKIRENSEEVFRVRAKYINYTGGIVDETMSQSVNTIIRIVVPTDYKFNKWDTIAFVDEGGLVDGIAYEGKTIWGEIMDVDGLKVWVRFEGRPFGETVQEINEAINASSSNRRYRAFYTTESVPVYAKYVSQMQSFVWRKFLNPSLLPTDSELYDMPFANGRHYIEKNINFFLRRQDPEGEFGLLWAKGATAANPMDYFKLSGERIDLSQPINFFNNLNNVCY